MVDDVQRVHSVDIVLNPATNAGLFESEQREIKPMPKTFGAVLESAKKSDKRAARLLEMMDAMDYPVEAEMEVEPSSDEPAADVDAAAASLVVEVIKDPAIDPAETKKKVNKILDALAPAKEPVQEMDDEEDPPAEESEEEKPVAESAEVKRLVGEVGELKALIESLKQEQSRPQVRSLREQKNERPSGTLSDYFKSAKR